MLSRLDENDLELTVTIHLYYIALYPANYAPETVPQTATFTSSLELMRMANNLESFIKSNRKNASVKQMLTVKIDGSVKGKKVPPFNHENENALAVALQLKQYVAVDLGIKPASPSPLGIDLRM